MATKLRSTRPARTARPSLPPLPPLPRAAWALLVLLASAMLLLLVSYAFYDTDLWQHLIVGKVMWTQHRIPHTQEWVWPIHGEPDVMPSWLFRVLLYPFWAIGGEHGIFVWRWLTALGAFAMLWAAARAGGARGPWALVALLWCAMLYRYRSQARPETFVALLVAAQLWVLERRRAQGVEPGKRDPAWLVVPIALLWANAHISYYIGLVITAAYWLSAVLPSREPRAPQAARGLFLAGLASAAVSFVNPFGWQALWQPFEYFLVWRHEPIYQIIGELQPVDWSTYMSVLLPFFFAAIGVLAIWRAVRRGPDVVQIVLLVLFVPQALGTQRFLGYLGVIVAPFFARDLDAWCDEVRGGLLDKPLVRTALVALFLVTLPFQALRSTPFEPDVRFRWNEFPKGVCDWIEAHGVRGKSFNAFGYGGYMLWRFYPDPGRLPFMDIHQAGTKLDRYRAAYARTTLQAWRELDAERHFDYVVWPTRQYPGEHLLDYLDADSTWALVFHDDAGSLYLRRDGPLAALAARERYHWLPAGDDSVGRLGQHAAADSTLRAAVRADLERAAASSPYNGRVHSLLANIAFQEGRWADAEREMLAALAANPDMAEVHERLGLAMVYAGHPAPALREFALAAPLAPNSKSLDFRRGLALQALGRKPEAKAAYERALERDPANAEAADSLRALAR